MKILITGGNGFVGRAVVRKLVDQHEVMVVDQMRYGALHIDRDIFKKITFEKIDICDAVATKRAVDGFCPDAIIHLAAIHYIPECEANPEHTVHVNVSGTINLIQACPEGARFVFASSGAVYAPSLDAHDEEKSATKPNDVYGLSKLHAEDYLSYFADRWGRQVVAVRLFNVVGRGETSPHVLPEIILQLKDGLRALKLGIIANKRDFIHVEDAADGFIAAALNGTVMPGQLIRVNVGSGVTYSIIELLAMLECIIGEKITVNCIDERVRKIDRPFLCAKIDKVAREFGWQPQRTAHQALRECWEQTEFLPNLLDRLSG